MAGAMSATMVVSSITYAQQPTAPPPAATSRSTAAPPPPTWTLFLVTVLYKSGWSVAPVAAFTGDKAEDDCQNAKNQLNKLPGISESNAEAKRTKGNTQYPICLHATAPQQPRSGSEEK